MTARRSSHIPADWIDAPNHCSSLIFGRFFACKAPLGDSYSGVNPRSDWRVEHALRAAREVSGGRDVSLAFDLTAGSGFYDRSRRPWGQSCTFRHIPCGGGAAGRDAAPQESAFHAFHLAVTSAADDGGVVAVHCRHGYNRTGYMICRSAVILGIVNNPAEAVAAFAAARPPGIYKPEYITALFASVGYAAPERVPRWPMWRAARRAADGLPPLWRTELENRRAPWPIPPRFLPFPSSAHEIGSVVPLVMDCASVVRACAAHACGCQPSEFGGAQPLALGRAELQAVRTGHVVSWKSDGVRLIVVILPFGVFGLNRAMEVRHLGTLSGAPDAGVLHRTCPIVIDAELVLADRNVGRRKMLWAIDLLQAWGTCYRNHPHCHRNRELQRFVSGLRKCRAWIRETGTGQSISLTRKGWWDASQARSVLEDPRNSPCDGLVFMPSDGPYVSGRDPKLLKWKRPADVTIDFYVHYENEAYVLWLADMEPPDKGVLLNPGPEWAHSVVECRWDREHEGWLALHVRQDKLMRGNARDAFNDTWRVIQEEVSLDDVVCALCK